MSVQPPPRTNCIASNIISILSYKCLYRDDSQCMESFYELSLYGDVSIKYTIDVPGLKWIAFSKNQHDIYYSSEFLSNIQINSSPPIHNIYVEYYKNDILVGISLMQYFHFSATHNIQNLDLKDKAFLKWATKQFGDLNVLIIGNLLNSGKHTFKFLRDISENEKTTMMKSSLKGIAKKRNLNVQFYLLKDVPYSFDSEDGFITIEAEPNMVLEIQKEWNNYDDYLGSMYSKCRVRARRAKKLLGNLEVKELGLKELLIYKKMMLDLYQQTADAADFNIVRLKENYFFDLKKNIGDDFKVIAYFDRGVMIGFLSILYNQKEAEAHYLGFNHSYNDTHQLYLNMLFQIVEEGINHSVSCINFCRTAPVIKSSIGAVERKVYNYAFYKSPLINKFISFLAKKLVPVSAYQMRHPFKSVH